MHLGDGTLGEVPVNAETLRAAQTAVQQTIPILVALWKANYSVYGARKLWVASRKAGHEIGRDQIARLMKQAGFRGCRS